MSIVKNKEECMLLQKNKPMKKKFKNPLNLRRFFKRYNKQGIDFSPGNKKTEKMLMQMGINIIGGACGGLIGAGIGFYVAGPPGAVIGGITGAIIGVAVVNGVIYRVTITKHRNGTFTANFQPV